MAGIIVVSGVIATVQTELELNTALDDIALIDSSVIFELEESP